MKKVKKVISEILDIQRGTVEVSELGPNTATLLLLGYYSNIDLTGKVSLDLILNSSDVKKAVNIC